MIKKYFLYSIVIYLQVHSSAHGATATQTYNKIRPLIVQVKTAASSTLEKSSYGSGFVVNKSGLIITNYHVVAETIWNPEKLKSYVVIGKKNLAAKIINVDFLNDLALLKIEHQFPGEIELAKELPVKGADIYSLGLPEDLEWTVVKGIYNGLVKRGPLSSFYMSTPINSGMSGGPIVNSDNELVAVNASIYLFSSQISFGVPLQAIKDILAQKKINLLTTKQHYLDKLRTQLFDFQNKFTSLLERSFQKEKKLYKVLIPDLSPDLKCWGDSIERKDLKYRIEMERCSNDYGVRVDNSIEGNYESSFQVMENLSMNKLSWQSKISSISALNLNGVADRFDAESTINYSPLKCIRENVIHHSSRALVTICYQKIIQLHDLFDFYVSFYKPLTNKKSLSAQFRLSGFTNANMKKIVNLMLEKNFEILP